MNKGINKGIFPLCLYQYIVLFIFVFLRLQVLFIKIPTMANRGLKSVYTPFS